MKLGIQMYSVREEMAKNPTETIKKIVGMGFKNLEIANAATDKDPGIGFGMSAGDVKKLLADLDARVVSAHLRPLIAGEIAPVLDYHKEIGTEYIVLPMDFYGDFDDVKKKADNLEKVGKECKAAGLQFVYHNHFHEFQVVGGATILDTLMDNTDPEHVKLELDTYWVMRAGIAPEDILKKYGKRVCLIHQKDYPKGYEDQINVLAKLDTSRPLVMEDFISVLDMKTFTEIGTGIMDIQGIIDTAQAHCAVEYIVLEQDATQLDPMESVALSRKNFEKYSGISFD